MNYNTTPFRLLFTAATLVMSLSECAAPSYVSRVTQAVMSPVVNAGKAEADDVLFEKKWIVRGPLYAVSAMSAIKAVDAACDSICGVGLAAFVSLIRKLANRGNPAQGENIAMHQASRAVFFTLVSTVSFLGAHYGVPRWQEHQEHRQQQAVQEVVAPARI